MNSTTQPQLSSLSVSAGKSSLFWVSALCALPVLTALLSFRPDGDFAVWQMYIRQFWLPSQFFEIATVVFAFSRGCSVQKSFGSFTTPVKALALIWLAAMLLAAQPATALLSLISWLIHGLFAISAWFLFKRWQGNWQSDFVDAMPLGSAIFALTIGGFIAFVGITTDYDWVSSLPGFPHIRHSGYFLMPAMALSAGAIALSTGNRRLLHMVLLAINFGFAIWIGSRGPLMIFAGMLALAFAVFAVMRNPRAIAAIALALGIGAVLSQVVPTPGHSSFNVVSRVSGSDTQSVDKLSSGRTEIWRDTLQAIVDQPLVGHGGNQFRLQIPAAKETYNHPHNSVLQFAYEWGSIGACAMLILLAMLGVRLLRATFANPAENLALFLGALSMAMFSLIDGLFYYNLPIILFLTCAFGILKQRDVSPAR